jgi:hypothetical protein
MRFRLYIGLPAYFFVSGLSCFGTTVLITVLGVGLAAALFLYALLGMLVGGGAVYIVGRIFKAGSEKPISYVIVPAGGPSMELGWRNVAMNAARSRASKPGSVRR